MFHILHKILQSHPFLVSRNFEILGYQSTESNGLNLFSRIRGIVEQGLRHFFITSSRFDFFNKTDLEQYLLNKFTTSKQARNQDSVGGMLTNYFNRITDGAGAEASITAEQDFDFFSCFLNDISCF